MNAPTSSTAPVEAKWLRRGTVIGSTGTEQMARTVHIVPGSSETLTLSCGTWDVPFALPEDCQAVLGKYVPYVETVAGIVTRQYAGHTGSLIIELPTRRLIAESFQRTGLFGAPSVEWLPELRVTPRSGWLPALTTMRVARLGAAGEPAPLPSLLNSTDRALGTPPLIESKFAQAVALAREEWFEDGVESKFSQALSTLVYTYGHAALGAVESFVRSPSSNIEIAVEAAQWLGEVDHSASHRYRRSLLERLLSAPSTRLRHGAAAGLAAMDDPSSLSALLEARDRESNRRLRHYLELVVDQLERTRACLSS